MSATPDEFTTVFLTVLTGTSVYVLGQIIQGFWLIPVLELRKTIADIGETLIYRANLYANPVRSSAAPLPPNYLECYEELRSKASLLRAKAHMVPGYCIFAWLDVLPCIKDVGGAATDLILLSNSLGGETMSGRENSDHADRVKKKLGLQF